MIEHGQLGGNRKVKTLN